MPWYPVMIRGENFLFPKEEGAVRLGFYTSRVIEAPSEQEVERCAIQHIRDDTDSRSFRLRTMRRTPIVKNVVCP